MSKPLQQFIYLMTLFEGLILSSTYLITPNVLANPLETTSSDSEFSFEENLKLQELSPSLPRDKLTDSCHNFTPIQEKNGEELLPPTSLCASDLTGVSSISKFNFATPKNLITQENTPDSLPESPQKNEENQPKKQGERWHFSFQPYATIPVTAYGTATARGRTVSYSQSLGEILDNLRMTASGRVEAWKDRLGFILDGYYVSLKGVDSRARTRSRVPNTINAINFLLSKEVNTKFQDIANFFDKDVEILQKVQALQESEVIPNLEQKIQNFQEIAAADRQTLRELEQKIQTIKATAGTDIQTLQELQQKIQTIQASSGIDAQTLQELEQKIQTLRDIGSIDGESLRELEQKIQTLKETAGTDIQALRELQQKIQTLRETKDMKAEELRALEQQLQNFQARVTQGAESLRTLQQNVQNFKQTVAQGAESLRTLQEKVQDFRENVTLDAKTLLALQQKIQDLRENVNLNGERFRALVLKLQEGDILNLDRQELKDLITLINETRDRFPEQEDLNAGLQQVAVKLDNLQQLQDNLSSSRERLEQASQKLDQLQALQEEISSLNRDDIQRFYNKQELEAKLQNVVTKIEDLEQLRQELIASKERLEQASQQIEKLRALQDSDSLQQLKTEIENAKATLEQNIEDINKIKQFQENREVQQLTSTSETELRFDQGIYDIALSYNIGDLPIYERPDKSSNLTFPRVWFQPIAGVRINDINIKIDETINLKLSSSLINFEGTFQETFQQGRTWFDPLLGGKLGIQISEPLIIWARGDYAGFGLAGDTDYSWNVLFGIDWWVRRRLSLQLAYRFYEINYRVGSGNNAYGFSENLNGPFVSATFHF